MKKILSFVSILSLLILLIIPINAHAIAVMIDDLTLSADCSEGDPENYYWELGFNDNLGSRSDDGTFVQESFYLLEAPCKVFLGDTFEIRITATDDVCKTGNFTGTIADRWSLVDTLLSGPPVVTTVDSGNFWSNDINVYPTGVWQKSYMRPTPSADNHTITFNAIDMGYCSGGHSWTGFVSQSTVVDPVRGGATENTPPTVSAYGDGAVYNLLDRLLLSGVVSDEEGDELSYQWFIDASVVASGSVSTIEGGFPVRVPVTIIGNGLSLGTHLITLEVSDGEFTESSSISVEYVDNVAPTLAPVADTKELWPPNKEMIPVQINFNAFDNSGDAPAISLSVTSSGKHSAYSIESVDEAAGTASLLLKAGKDVLYKVEVIAEDASGNSARATVEIRSAKKKHKNYKKGHDD